MKNISKEARPIIAVILFLFITMLIWVLMPHFGHGDARPIAASLDIIELSVAVDQFKADIKRYPSTTEGLRVLAERPGNVSIENWHGPYIMRGIHSDPWGNDYQYTLTPIRQHGVDYEIISSGIDGKFGTYDDIKSFEPQYRIVDGVVSNVN